MAVHAAMIDRMDRGIGQVVDALEKTGQLDNTLILFSLTMVVAMKIVRITLRERMTARI